MKMILVEQDVKVATNISLQWKRLSMEEKLLGVNYLKELTKRKNDELPEVKEFPPKKRGRPLLVGNKLDAQVQLYVKELQNNGAVINIAIVMATAEGLVQHHDVNLLAKHRGPIAIIKHRARSLFLRMQGMLKLKLIIQTLRNL